MEAIAFNPSISQLFMFGIVAPVTGWLIAAMIADVVRWWKGPIR